MAKYDIYDKFGVENMSKEEHQERQEYVVKNCRCAGCPSYVEGDAPVGYCFPLIGTSKKIQKEVECLCSSCPIYNEFELDHTYYCTRCSQVCQTVKTEGGLGQGGAG